ESAVPLWPALGADLGEFRLLAEIGRGSQGRVFLATQAGLADRPVVLKITPCSGHEHLALARLQHTHIVPLYSAHDDRTRNLRILCMPYFGGTSLHEILKRLKGTPPAMRTGRHVLEVLDRLQAERPMAAHPLGSGKPPAAQAPARQLLARCSWTQVVC